MIGKRELKQVDGTKIICIRFWIIGDLSAFLFESYFLKGYIKKLIVSRQGNQTKSKQKKTWDTQGLLKVLYNVRHWSEMRTGHAYLILL